MSAQVYEAQETEAQHLAQCESREDATGLSVLLATIIRRCAPIIVVTRVEFYHCHERDGQEITS